MYEEQRKADFAHHFLRRRWLLSDNPKYDSGEAVMESDRRQMLKASLTTINSNAVIGFNTCHCEPRCTLDGISQPSAASNTY